MSKKVDGLVWIGVEVSDMPEGLREKYNAWREAYYALQEYEAAFKDGYTATFVAQNGPLPDGKVIQYSLDSYWNLRNRKVGMAIADAPKAKAKATASKPKADNPFQLK